MKFSASDKLLKSVDKLRKNFPQHVNRISSIGYPCIRNNVYQITHWDEKEIPSIELQLIFNEGRHQERAIKRDLEEAGITIIRQEEPVWFDAERLSGHGDGIIQYHRSQIALEIKSMSPHLFDKINTAEDLMNSSFPYHRCYIAQLQMYMRGFGLANGILLIKNKNNGAFREIQVVADKPYQATLLNKCKTINESVDKIRKVLSETYQIKEIADFRRNKDLADYMTIKNEACALVEEFLPERVNDDNICKMCPFNRLCLPDEIRKERIKVWINAELETMLERREALINSHSEYETIDAEVKDKIKASGEDDLIIGDFQITVSHGKNIRVKIERGLTGDGAENK